MTTCTASPCSTAIVRRCSTKACTGTTVRCATRSTTGARSRRAACTRAASPARTATNRIRSSSGPTALRFARNVTSPRSTTPSRTRITPPGTPGAACAACHMPTTTYMLVDPRHDHSMRIPRPDLSAKLGMPNACNNCHTKQTAQWSADAIATWTGKPPASFQNFAMALNDGTRAAPAARGELLALIQDKAQPAIVRASAIRASRPAHYAGDAAHPRAGAQRP